MHTHLLDAVAGGDAVLQAMRGHLDRRQGYMDAKAFAWQFRHKFTDRPTLAFLGYGDEGGRIMDFHPKMRDCCLRNACGRHRVLSFLSSAIFVFVRMSSNWCDLIKHLPTIHARPWYVETIARGARTTSAPYPWYDSELIGVTVAEPYHDPKWCFAWRD